MRLSCQDKKVSLTSLQIDPVSTVWMLDMFKTKVKRPYFHQFSHGAESSVGLDFANIEEAQPFAKEV